MKLNIRNLLLGIGEESHQYQKIQAVYDEYCDDDEYRDALFEGIDTFEEWIRYIDYLCSEHEIDAGNPDMILREFIENMQNARTALDKGDTETVQQFFDLYCIEPKKEAGV